jgi:hypothetical protein
MLLTRKSEICFVDSELANRALAFLLANPGAFSMGIHQNAHNHETLTQPLDIDFLSLPAIRHPSSFFGSPAFCA